MQAAFEDCTLSNRILNAILIQIIPGKDEDILKEIDRKFGDKTSVYVGFGRYDFIILREESDFSLLNAFQKSELRFVKDWFPLLGLKWKVENKRGPQHINKSKLLGFCCIKLDPVFSIAKGIDPVADEISLVKDIRSKLPCHIYSGLGFDELIIIIQAQKFEELARKLVSIKKSLVGGESSAALDISTIPAINYRLFVKDKKAIDTLEEIQAYLLLSLKVGISKEFKKKLEDISGTEEISIFGFHDIMLKVSGTTSQVVDIISQVRKQGFDHGLYSTYTIVPHYDEGLDLKVPVKQELEKFIEPGTIKEETCGYEEDSSQISFYKKWYETIKQDPLTKHVFRDNPTLFAEAEKFSKEVQELKRSEIGRYMIKNQELDNLQECLRVGFEQRCSGILPGNLLGQRTITTESLGSLQRAIMAIESLPLFLFNRLEIGPWCGFCIYGYASRFYRTQCGIINIPSQHRIRPEMWWGIFHEIGHEAFNHLEDDMKVEIVSEIYKIVREITTAKRTLEETGRLEIAKSDVFNFVEEIFAELFGFHFGFNDDWNLYKEKFWSYFSKEFKIDFEHLTRSVMAYFTLGPGKHLMRDEISVDEIDRCLGEIENVIKKAVKRKIDDKEWDRTIPVFWAFLDVADVIRSHFGRKPSLYSNTRMREINIALKKGMIVRHDNPLEILLSFVSDKKQHDCKHRFATILSLYNSYLKLLQEQSIEGS